jgi:4-hydroxy-tetrahydrodipicolinate synthase
VKSIQFAGNIPPLLTPLLPDESIDEESLRRLVAHLIAGGVDGVFVMGSSGEGPLLTVAQKRQVIKIAVEAIGGRVPLLVGASECSAVRAIELMNSLADLKFDAFVQTLPYYGAFPDAQAQIAYFRALADASPRPLVVYNIPPAVHANILPDTVTQLASHPNIVALKDSFGDLAAFNRTIVSCRGTGLRIFQGSEVIAGSSLFVGADGLVSGLGNLVPGWLSTIIVAARQNDWEKVRVTQERMLKIHVLHMQGHWLGCLKTAASLMGLCGPTTMRPIEQPTPEAKERIRAILASEHLC